MRAGAPDNVAILDSWTEFTARISSNWETAVDISTSGVVTLSHNRDGETIQPFNLTLVSTAFTGCSLVPLTSTYPAGFFSQQNVSGDTVKIGAAVGAGFATASWTASWQLDCPVSLRRVHARLREPSARLLTPSLRSSPTLPLPSPSLLA